MSKRSDDKNITLMKKPVAKPQIRHDDICEVECVDKKKLTAVRKHMEDPVRLANLAELFNALGDTTRVSIIHALAIDELCVCELAALIGMSQSAVSHQLRLLRYSRLVKYRKAGKMVYYSLDDEHVKSILLEGLKHVREDRK
jgi:ArsR family transcriptional regulator, lead/cadmium/zinc/bismuth-responsive transcriptional repressor